MKTIKLFILAIAMFAMATPAFADQQLIDSLVGAVAGGGVGRYACRNCKQSTKNIATGVAALGGAWVGSKVGDDSGQRFQQDQQQRADIANARMAQNDRRQEQPVYQQTYARSAPTTWINNEVEVAPVAVTRVVRAAPVARTAECDEEYYHGNFNPEVAHAYCEGRRQREQAVRQAYSEGLAGR